MASPCCVPQCCCALFCNFMSAEASSCCIMRHRIGLQWRTLHRMKLQSLTCTGAMAVFAGYAWTLCYCEGCGHHLVSQILQFLAHHSRASQRLPQHTCRGCSGQQPLTSLLGASVLLQLSLGYNSMRAGLSTLSRLALHKHGLAAVWVLPVPVSCARLMWYSCTRWCRCRAGASQLSSPTCGLTHSMDCAGLQ